MADPTPSFAHGKNSCVYINGYNLSEFFKSVEFGRTKETVEATTFRARGKRFVGGFPDSSISAEGIWDPQDDAIDEVLDAAIQGDDEDVWLWYPQGESAVGAVGYGTQSISTNHTISGSVDDVIATAIEGQPTVDRERVKSHHPDGTETATGNGTEVDSGITGGTALGGTAYLHVFEVAGSGTFDVDIEMDDTTGFPSATTLMSFTQVTAARTAERIATATLTTAVEQFTRVAWTITGFTSVRFAVGFHRTVVSDSF